MPVSIKDVAVRAGTSRGTVSKVLNDAPEARVSISKRQHIIETAREMGYVPNHAARALGRGKSDTLGLVISELRNPFFADLAAILEPLARSAGYRLLIEVAQHNVREDKAEDKTLGNISAWPLDGLIVWAEDWQKVKPRPGAASRNAPTVYIGHERRGPEDWVSFDLEGGGRMAAEHAFDRGYGKVMYVTPFHNADVEMRVLAYEAVCRERNKEPAVMFLAREEVSRRLGVEGGLEIANLPKNRRPDAVLCHNDVIAVGVYQGILRAGLRVPTDIAVVGFDGIEEGQCLAKPLTTIVASNRDLARAALETLLMRVNGDQSTGAVHTIVPVKLAVGLTT